MLSVWFFDLSAMRTFVDFYFHFESRYVRPQYGAAAVKLCWRFTFYCWLNCVKCIFFLYFPLEYCLKVLRLSISAGDGKKIASVDFKVKRNVTVPKQHRRKFLAHTFPSHRFAYISRYTLRVCCGCMFVWIGVHGTGTKRLQAKQAKIKLNWSRSKDNLCSQKHILCLPEHSVFVCVCFVC